MRSRSNWRRVRSLEHTSHQPSLRLITRSDFALGAPEATPRRHRPEWPR
jgi:hypothetical protein